MCDVVDSEKVLVSGEDSCLHKDLAHFGIGIIDLEDPCDGW